MRWKYRLVIVFCVMLALLSGCAFRTGTGWGNDLIFRRMTARCKKVTAMYDIIYQQAEKTEPEDRWSDPCLTQSGLDAIETLLTEAGLDVLDTQEPYPSYLPTPERLYDFLDTSGRKNSKKLEIFGILPSGDLSYRLFQWENGELVVYSMCFHPGGTEPLEYERNQGLDWELTEKGNFFYRIYPAEFGHYEDYALIRTVRPDPELWDLAERYLSPAGYVAANLFLTDWWENDWNDLCLNDIWDHIYYFQNGEQYQGDPFAYVSGLDGFMVPSQLFEGTLLPYLCMNLETFRDLASYDAARDAYPWRPLRSNDFLFLEYPSFQPEVTACQDNSDGTITLTVEMMSTDLKTDCLFAHALTVRPLEDSGFQYVGNRVTYQTQYGLPYCAPRLTWNRSD